MSDINEPTLPAIPEAAVEALVADLVQECERAIKQHEAALLDPSKRGGYIQTHDTMFGFIVRKHVAALPPLSIPAASAPIQGEDVHTKHTLFVGALTATDARVVELEREAAQWQAAAGQLLVRAEALEDRLETVERERDEARDRARILGDKYNQWFERAEAAEAEVARLERERDDALCDCDDMMWQRRRADERAEALEAELAAAIERTTLEQSA